MPLHIPINNRKGEELFALVDDEDFNYLSQFSWSMTGNNGCA